MEETPIFRPSSSTKVVEDMDEFQELLQTIPKVNWDGRWLYYYNNFWCPERVLKSTIFFQRNFKAKDSDIILASIPKSGTTWLKSLSFTIINRKKCTIPESPLLITNPHDLVRSMEYGLFLNSENPDLEAFSCPRIFSTHLPYHALPQSILNAKCRIIYICRNPLDQFISLRHFLLENSGEDQQKALPIDEAFELFCKGLYPFGPVWDHAEGYWNASLNDVQKVVFLKYEDLKIDATSHVKMLAEFLRFPFSPEEVENGVVEEIVKLCSLENLKNMEVNKNGVVVKSPTAKFKAGSYFRKGEVGDWKNFLNNSMAERYKKIMEEKLGKSGLAFELL
ncbi:cytosolic sulfotransferase 15-like [Coffea arabica]|uniref:Sulfotransferase n=1 Tax=Coffea arabica TaxID=13443 RepID=A0A6P6TWT7_COFAR